jgi:hypothetical protein
MLASWAVSSRLKVNLNNILKCSCKTVCGAEIADDDGWIRDVRVISVAVN